MEIKEKIEDLPQNEISLVYNIVEGEKVYITKIEFVGNNRFDNGSLGNWWFDYGPYLCPAFYSNSGQIRRAGKKDSSKGPYHSK